jgi:hypothetical protein
MQQKSGPGHRLSKIEPDPLERIKLNADPELDMKKTVKINIYYLWGHEKF